MTQADLNTCVLRLDDLSTEIVNWTSYRFSTNFLTPTDGFSFTIGDPDLPRGLSGQIREGQKVTLLVDGRPTCTGYIDEWSAAATRDGGIELTLTGRDVLADAVDSCVDPTLRFKESQTLEQIVIDVFASFGFDIFLTSNDSNRDLISGNQYGFKVNKTRVTKRGRVTKASGKPLSSYLQHRAKPYPHEGAYEFCARLAKRQGLHIWATADGQGIVLGKPDFAQPARFELVRKRGQNSGAMNNIVAGTVTKTRQNQPSVIIATGVGGGGEFGRGRCKVAMVNELIAHDASGAVLPQVQQALNAHPDAYVIGVKDLDEYVSPVALNPYPKCRPLFLHDDESKDIEQLKNFVKREMATRQQQALQVQYDVAGHTQSGQTWAVDTVATVDDDVGDLHEDAWIMGVEFTKSRTEGTRTGLTLIRPYTMRF